MEEAIIRYFHFLGIIALASSLIAENLLIAKAMTAQQIRQLARVDLLYGIAAMVTLVAGLLLWFGVGKPKAFYSDNMLFHIKLGLFVIVGLVSIVPTVFFLRHRATTQPRIVVPSRVLMTLRLQLIPLLLLPLLAVLMAKGIGYRG